MPVTETSNESYTKTWKLSWTFEADLREEAKFNLKSKPILPELPGTWVLRGKRQEGPDPGIAFGLFYTGASLGCFGSDTKSVYRLYAVYPQHETKVCGSFGSRRYAWPPFVSGLIDSLRVSEERLNEVGISLAAQRSWRLEVELSTSDVDVPRRCHISRTAVLITPSHDQLTTNNVRLYFPNTELELWTTSSLLCTSPFFRSLFQSGFAEASTTRTTRKRRKTESAATALESVDADEGDLAFEDSDAEGDEIFVNEERSAVDPGDADYKEVRISATAFSTYRALLTWLTTSHIDFARLSSSFKRGNTGEETPDQRRKDVDVFHKAQPNLPLLVSPKSVYRLAHFLELPDLQAIALRAYKSQLDKCTVVYELVSDVSAVYDELRFAALDVAAKDFACVKTGEAMKEITKAMEDDEALALRFAKVMGELFARG